MSVLITELKRQHAALVDCLNGVQTLGIGSRAGQEKLMSAKTLLLAHLKKEDDKLYPALRTAAAADADLKRTLDALGKEMVDLAAAAMQFFERWANGGSSLEFAREFGKLVAALLARIRKEESTLYPAYERLESGALATSPAR